MKFLFASDSFKGTLSSEKTVELLSRAANEVFPGCICSGIPLADGGEGTVNALVNACHGVLVKTPVSGPLMENILATYGILGGDKAIIEMAAAAGLTLIPDDKRNPLNTTTYGVGELILDAAKHGCRDISVAIGGSGTNDGGMGCARALGVRFFDNNGGELACFGKDLIRVSRIDTSGINPAIRECRFTIMCDVTNPLCGLDGATLTYGKQKGGTPETLAELERGMLNYRSRIYELTGTDCNLVSGAGAAGGLGVALSVFCNGEMKSGIETVLDLICFDDMIKDVDLVVTGEGRLDYQSCFGKAVYGIGVHCKMAGVPAIALVGSVGEGAEEIFKYGIGSIMTTVDSPMTLEEALEHAEELYYSAAVRMFRMIKIGRG